MVCTIVDAMGVSTIMMITTSHKSDNNPLLFINNNNNVDYVGGADIIKLIDSPSYIIDLVSILYLISL